jgi:pyruvate-formate lyase-activating enzyme
MQRYDFANILFAGPCNLRCPYCIGKQIDPALNRNNLHEFPLRNLDTFTDLLRRHDVRQVVLTGTTTDPQLYRLEARLILWLRERLPGVRLSLHTNGQLALQKMDTFNLYDRVSLSLPSFDPDVHAKMTGSPRVPDLAAIVQAARVPVKVSCVVNEHNAGRLDGFLARCHELGIRRVVLRQLYGDSRWWPLPWRLRRIGTYRDNPVYDYHGMEVTFWRFDTTASTSLNLFSDGTISDEYLLTGASPQSTCREMQGPRPVLTPLEGHRPVCIS